jgi:hypothetical protein
MAPEYDRNSEDRGQDNEKILGRILAFSDGVFAFAITLLIIDVRLPAGISSADLNSTLIERSGRTTWRFCSASSLSAFIGPHIFGCSGKLYVMTRT